MGEKETARIHKTIKAALDLAYMDGRILWGTHTIKPSFHLLNALLCENRYPLIIVTTEIYTPLVVSQKIEEAGINLEVIY